MCKDKLKEIEEVLEGWVKKELTDLQAVYLIHDTIYPATIDQEDIDWAKSSKLKEEAENERSKSKSCDSLENCEG